MFIEYELEKAQEILLSSVGKLSISREMLEKALLKVVAEDIVAPINVPGFRRSPLDGFALRAADTKGALLNMPLSFKVIDEVQAGDTRQIDKLPLGCAFKILTGAPVPLEADVVIRKEDVDFSSGKIKIVNELKKDSNVVFAGSDIKEGEKIFSQGEIVTPYHIGVLAALGIKEIPVYKTSKIGLISTGDELKNPGEPLENGQIYNSNMFSLQALINSSGGQAYNLGIVPDNKEIISNTLRDALKYYDLIITTGGASVGDYDLIERVLRENNAKILFNRVEIKPGSPVICGLWDGKLIIGLSGNPAAALISFELLVRPLLKKMIGITDVKDKYLEVELLDGFSKRSPQRRFLRVRVLWADGKWIAYLTGKQESGILRSMVGCNALIDIPRGSGQIAPNTKVRALLLETS